MKIGLSTHSFALWPLRDRHFAIIKDAGFDAVEIWGMAPHVEIETPGSVVFWGAAAARAGIEVLSVHLPFYERWGAPNFRYLNLGDTDREAARLASRLIQRCLAQAKSCGASVAVIHGIGGAPGDDAEKLRLFHKDLTPIVEMAAERGVVLAIENIMTPLSDSIHVAQIVDHFDTPHLRACLDVGHAHVSENLFGAVSRLRERVVHAHIHDNHGDADEHLVPGAGSIDWDVTAGALAEFADPNLILELRWPMAGPDIDEALFLRSLGEARDAMRRVFGA